MGCCFGSENSASASVTVSAGQHTEHCCFAVCLRADVFQAKYATMPTTFTVTPGPGAALYGKYGVGTKFTGAGAFGIPEVLSITQVTYPSKVAFNSGGNVDIEYTIQAEGADSVRLSVSIKGPKVYQRQKVTEMQLEVMRAFIEANAEQILASSPLDTSSPGGEFVAAA